MKKLVFMFVAVAAISFASCGGNKTEAPVVEDPEVQELAWYLSCLTPMGLLERCHSYKDKMAHGFDATHGLFAYPVLMAADIFTPPPVSES